MIIENEDDWALLCMSPEQLNKIGGEISGTLKALEFIDFIRWSWPEHFHRFIVDDEIPPGKMYVFDRDAIKFF